MPEDRSAFNAPANHKVLASAEIPALENAVVNKTKKLEIAHRDDDNGWMTGMVKKHKITKRSGSTGKTYDAKTEFKLVYKDHMFSFLLRQEERDLDGEWVLYLKKQKTEENIVFDQFSHPHNINIILCFNSTQNGNTRLYPSCK